MSFRRKRSLQVRTRRRLGVTPSRLAVFLETSAPAPAGAGLRRVVALLNRLEEPILEMLSALDDAAVGLGRSGLLRGVTSGGQHRQLLVSPSQDCQLVLLQMRQVLQVLQVSLPLEQGHMDAVEGSVGEAAVCGQFLGVQFRESFDARLDLLAEETPPPGEQAQL